jgi:hypothetical protein
MEVSYSYYHPIKLRCCWVTQSEIPARPYGDGSKPWYLVNPKIAGKWMFIPLKMVLIGIDPYPYEKSLVFHEKSAFDHPISLASHCPGHQRLASAAGSRKEDATGRPGA